MPPEIQRIYALLQPRARHEADPKKSASERKTGAGLECLSLRMAVALSHQDRARRMLKEREGLVRSAVVAAGRQGTTRGVAGNLILDEA
ncbi:MAG: hypothetical protein M1829_005662 [Trizodia sp. TS-e1964]|nr:MAG: hypothetical protein M1829_005662 [Trizodia sp. TS-e1964]